MILFSIAYIIFLFKQASNGSIEHIETRPNELDGNRFDIFLSVFISSPSLLNLMRNIRQGNLGDVNVLREKLISVRGIVTIDYNQIHQINIISLQSDPWFPRHISDLDFCTHIMTKYEPELDSDHPVTLNIYSYIE